MKIISRPPPFKDFGVTCKHCAAELEVNEDDIRYYFFSDQRDGTEEHFFVNCAVCREELVIATSLVPPLQANRLRKEKRGY